MKKMKNIIALITGGVMLLSTGMNVSAIQIHGHDGPELPEGMEYFEDNGVFSYIAEFDASTLDGIEGTAYKTVWKDASHEKFYVWVPVQQNFTIINFNREKDPSIWQGIYEKYRTELDSDFEEIDEYQVDFHDWYDENGNETADISDIPDKSDLVIEMCREMQEAGLLIEEQPPFYSRYYAFQLYYWFKSAALRVVSTTSTEDELQALVSAYDETLTVSAVDSPYYIYEINTTTTDQMLELAGVLREAEPEISLRADATTSGADGGSAEGVSFGEIDILAELEKPATTYGDLNQDGKVTVLDAITLSKANIQAITLNESQTAAADCNGDGLIDSADVTVLLCYLTDKVDVLPVTIE
ncbi:MAG: dockerin type I repeat-containing protein [Ruminococcus sp.]|nr:dockerin type I repeat-containing protein [Ruminococcus sp.]